VDAILILLNAAPTDSSSGLDLRCKQRCHADEAGGAAAIVAVCSALPLTA
jgi:hypothetical protein